MKFYLNRPGTWTVFLLLFGLQNETGAAKRNIYFETSTYNPIYASISSPTYKGLRFSLVENPLFPVKINGLRTQYQVDYAKGFVLIRHSLNNHDFRAPVSLGFEEYLNIRYEVEGDKQWRSFMEKSLFDQGEVSARARGVGIDIPIPIKSQALQKIFGGSTVGLEVKGNITIDGGLRHEKRSEVKTALNRQSNFNFKMKQTQRFTVTGNIGEKVNVFVDQDSERPFEFNNAVRLEYKGFDDEVIESIEAGNVSLSLPGSRFVTFSAKNTGLFGIKSNMRLGNLKMTMIASQEKGQKNKLSISGGATDDESKLDDYSYRGGTYFYLDDFYRQQYPDVNSEGSHIYDPNRTISRIEVYKSEVNYQFKVGEGAIRGWATAFLDEAAPDADTTLVDQNHYRGFFIRMEQTEYFVERDLGYIALEQPLRKGEVLAVAYRDTMGNAVGDVNFISTGERPIILRLLRTKNPQASDKSWDLEWKNVYYLGTKNIDKDGFELKIFFKPPSGDPQESVLIDGQQVSYLQALGLDKTDINGNPIPDNVLDDNPNIINWARGELIFPDLEPFNSDALPADKRVSAIYDTTDYQYITSKSRFYISTSAKIRQTNYSLGFNVIEGSEEILLNGRRLETGRDYVIDYFTGNLTLLDEQATDPNAALEISYESNQLFQIDRKTILGTRWDYELFNNSFIGGTLLYLNQSTLDQKVRIGQDGPMKNFVWNFNTSLNFEPFFLTRGLNALPFVQTKEPSTLKFEAEVAEIVPNPNSRDNPGTGDANGVVYIDDFESAKRETPLGILRKQWTRSSVPKLIPGLPGYDFLTDIQKDERRGKLVWYNPYEQVSIKEIWPNQDVNPNVPQRVHVLTMQFEREQQYLEESWAGIMRYLSAGYADQSTSKFLEVWVLGNHGRLHFEFGQISEDAVPNGMLDTEDIQRNGIRNGILDDDEDVGLDGVPGDDDLGVSGDAGDDDWFYESQGFEYDKINGTEGNLNDEGGRYPDTEDLNNNGDVDLRNDYFTFSFNVDPNHPDADLIAGTGGDGPLEPYQAPGLTSTWRMYRIPLNRPDTTVGNPQWTNVEYVRMWVDEAPEEKIFLRIAKINLVGSEWKERGLIAAGEDPSTINADDDSTVQITVVNTYDNPTYIPPPGVVGERDQVTKIVSREQSLVLKVNDLNPGYTGVVEKTFFKSQNYVNYDNMKMFVYGLDETGFHITSDTSQIEVSFRFGADNLNYYEFKQRVFPGWSTRNELILNFEELTGLKNRTEAQFLDKDGNIFSTTEDGDTIRVVGSPSLTNIRELTIAVINRHDTQPFTGEIWLNELRLSGVKKDKGMAARARINAKLADVGNVNMEVNRIDDDFRTVNERFGKGNNQLRGSLNASFQLEKFLPQGVGVSIPVTVGYDNSESSPKYFPGSDIPVSNKTASDSLLETIKTRNRRSSYSIGLRRNGNSRSPLMKYTLDAISVNYSFSESFNSNSIVEEAKTFTYSGNLTYNANFNSKVNIRPFGWLGNGPIIGGLSSTAFFFLPQRLNYRFTFNRRKDNKLNRTGLPTSSYTFVINQSAGIGFRPFRSLTLDITRSHANDLRNIENYTNEIFSGNLGPLTAINQTLKGQYNPSFSNWLKFTLSMNTNFKYNNNVQQQTLGKSAQNQVNYGFSFTLTPKQLVQNLTKGRKTTPVRRRTVPRRGEEEPEEKAAEADSGKGISIPNPLRLFEFIGNNLQPVSLRFGNRVSANKYAIQEIPSFAFQIGKTFDPGPVISQNVGTNRGSFVKAFNVDATSGVDINSRVRLTFKYDYDNSSTETTLINGSVSDSRLRLGESNVPFPDWTLRWSGLEKLSFLKKFVQRVTLEHGRTGKFVSKWQDDRANVSNETYNSSFRPLVGVNITWTGNLSSTVQFNQTFSEILTKRGGAGGTRKTRSDVNASVTYRKSGGFKIPFFGNKVIKNNMDFSMNFVKSLDVSEQKRGEQGVYQEHTRNEKWSITPRLTYSFSSTVRGGVHFEYGKTKHKILGETRITEFGINVNIQISGR